VRGGVDLGELGRRYAGVDLGGMQTDRFQPSIRSALRDESVMT